MNLARTDFESGVISRPEFLAQVKSINNCKDYVNDDNGDDNDDNNGGDNDDLAGEEEHEDGGGGKQLQVLHKGDEMLLHTNLNILKPC